MIVDRRRRYRTVPLADVLQKYKLTSIVMTHLSAKGEIPMSVIEHSSSGSALAPTAKVVVPEEVGRELDGGASNRMDQEDTLEDGTVAKAHGRSSACEVPDTEAVPKDRMKYVSLYAVWCCNSDDFLCPSAVEVAKRISLEEQLSGVLL